MKDYDGFIFDSFKKMAKNSSLSKYEKIGDSNLYRAGKEQLILKDIITKVPNILEKRNLTVLDIGSGCTDLPFMLSDLCKEQGHRLIYNDSQEMLEHLPDEKHIVKVAGKFPDVLNVLQKDIATEGVDIIISYSVFHYVFAEGNPWEFVDGIMSLLNNEGQCIIGDIPNQSKRKRFFASGTGIKFHQQFMKTSEEPKVQFNTIEYAKMDESVLISMILRCHSSGFDAYIVPQMKGLPFDNRRDDIIIRKP